MLATIVSFREKKLEIVKYPIALKLPYTPRWNKFLVYNANIRGKNGVSKIAARGLFDRTRRYKYYRGRMYTPGHNMVIHKTLFLLWFSIFSTVKGCTGNLIPSKKYKPTVFFKNQFYERKNHILNVKQETPAKIWLNWRKEDSSEYFHRFLRRKCSKKRLEIYIF